MTQKHSEFEKSVWEVLKKIPQGKVVSYLDVAKAIGKKTATRVVGNAVGKNPFAPKVPCHRVVKSDGKLGGYAGGIAEKIHLLKLEGVEVKNGRIVDFDSKRYFFKRSYNISTSNPTFSA